MEVVRDFRAVGRRGRDDRMSCVVPSRTATAEIAFGSKDIDELAFAFVAPLGAEDDGYCGRKIEFECEFGDKMREWSEGSKG